MIPKYISYEHYLKQEQRIKQLKHEGIVFIHKISKIRLLLGCTCLFIALVPNGLGLIFYPLGFALLVSAGVDIYALLENKRRQMRVFKNKIVRLAKC